MRRIQNGTGLAVFATLAVAVSAYAGPLETVTVTGSRGLTQKEVGKTSSGLPIEEISLSYTVKIADLDPNSPAGRAEIEKRVTAAAKTACAEIDRLALGNPTSPSDAACVKRAVDAAMAKIK
jgi:UrcA family protein